MITRGGMAGGGPGLTGCTASGRALGAVPAARGGALRPITDGAGARPPADAGGLTARAPGGRPVTLAALTGGAFTGVRPAKTAVGAGVTLGWGITCAFANC